MALRNRHITPLNADRKRDWTDAVRPPIFDELTQVWGRRISFTHERAVCVRERRSLAIFDFSQLPRRRVPLQEPSVEHHRGGRHSVPQFRRVWYAHLHGLTDQVLRKLHVQGRGLCNALRKRNFSLGKRHGASVPRQFPTVCWGEWKLRNIAPR